MHSLPACVFSSPIWVHAVALCTLTSMSCHWLDVHWLGWTSALGAVGKICILTGSKLRKHDMESRRDCRLSQGCDFFNRPTFGIWAKSQQLSGQNFYNRPFGKADVWLEIALLFYFTCSGFCIQIVCFLWPGNGDFFPLSSLSSPRCTCGL